jgi:hypothetical protein
VRPLPNSGRACGWRAGAGTAIGRGPGRPETGAETGRHRDPGRTPGPGMRFGRPGMRLGARASRGRGPGMRSETGGRTAKGLAWSGSGLVGDLGGQQNCTSVAWPRLALGRRDLRRAVCGGLREPGGSPGCGCGEAGCGFGEAQNRRAQDWCGQAPELGAARFRLRVRPGEYADCAPDVGFRVCGLGASSELGVQPGVGWDPSGWHETPGNRCWCWGSDGAGGWVREPSVRRIRCWWWVDEFTDHGGDWVGHSGCAGAGRCGAGAW